MSQETYMQQLVDYIKKNIMKGYTLESLKIALENQDYSKTSIERAIELANKQLAAEAPKMKEKPIIKYEVVEPAEEQASSNKEKKSFLKKLFD